MLSDFADKGVYETYCFTPDARRPKSEKLMKTIDKVNTTGDNRVTFAAQGLRKSWSMQRHVQSPKYTTDWDDLLVIK